MGKYVGLNYSLCKVTAFLLVQIFYYLPYRLRLAHCSSPPEETVTFHRLFRESPKKASSHYFSVNYT